MAFKIREKANTRVVSEETKKSIAANRKYVDLTFSVLGKDDEIRKTFAFSKQKLEELGLDNAGLLTGYDEETKRVIMLKVPEEQASLFKGKAKRGDEVKEGEAKEKAPKGRTFTSDVFLGDLQDAGFVPQDLPLKTKIKFDVTKIEGGVEIDGVKFEDAFAVTVAADTDEEEEEEVTDAEVKDADANAGEAQVDAVADAKATGKKAVKADGGDDDF